MIDKINCIKIIQEHIGTLKDFSTNKVRKRDLFVFFISPLIVEGIVFKFFHLTFSKELESAFITTYSIFAALLFNLIVLVISEYTKSKKNHSEPTYTDFLLQIHHNISFAILLAVTSIVILLIHSIFANVIDCLILGESVLFLLIYISSVFILTLFLVLKRIHCIIF